MTNVRTKLVTETKRIKIQHNLSLNKHLEGIIPRQHVGISPTGLMGGDSLQEHLGNTFVIL